MVAGHAHRGLGADAVALFRLTAHPTGRKGSFTIDTVTGTPLYTSADGDFWKVDELVSGTGPDTTIGLPAQPARCDIHAFGSATGGTTFFVNVTIDGEPAQVRIAMSPGSPTRRSPTPPRCAASDGRLRGPRAPDG